MRTEDIIKHFLIIACGVFKQEFELILSDISLSANIETVWLEQGLHRDPDRLNYLLREEISRAENADTPYDAVLLAYGICSRGTVGLSSEKLTIVMPRAHDCITLFLGSKERYLEEFSRAPGTYWFTPGFVGGAMQPGMSEKYAGVYHQFEEQYEDYVEKFGDEELARYVIDQQEQAWIKNYSRGAYVNSGLKSGKRLEKKAQAFCESRNWKYEEVRGDLSLLKDLLAGNWDDERFLVVDPGQTIVIGSVHDVVTTHNKMSDASLTCEEYQRYFSYIADFEEIDAVEFSEDRNDIDRVIGIDAGGTYTDAAIVSLRDNAILATGKSPTTHNDLAIGIGKALGQIPVPLLKSSCRLALSTTLATNAIVEGKGARTGLILIGYRPESVSLIETGSHDIKAVVPGCHDIYGEETEALDTSQLMKQAASMVQKGVEAFAISSYLAVRNPEHELKAKSLLSERFNLPVAAGHELSDDIDSVKRAHTVLLNARLLPVIASLVKSLTQVIADMGIQADIRLVTTDGSLMNTAEALEQPVRLILSGPAASVKGVRFLNDSESCVLVDMGGTTSDIAIIEKGSARRTGRGAVIGAYRTAIQAVDIRTIGLGGDSEIAWKNGNLQVGPERIIPITRLTAEHPESIEQLKAMKSYTASDYTLVQPGTHFLLMREPDSQSYLSDREKRIIDILRARPCSIIELSERLVYPYFSIIGTDNLEKLGIVRRSGLTPTDILHYMGKLSLWENNASETMLSLYTERSGLNTNQFISQCWNEIQRKMAAAVITETIAGGEAHEAFPGCKFCQSSFGKSSALTVEYKLNYPLVGIGAPAEYLLNGIDSHLQCEKAFPPYAEVANAIGAASGSGGIHIDMKIMQHTDGRFALYSPSNLRYFGDLDAAKQNALEESKRMAREYAIRMGYDSFRLMVHIRDRSAPTSFDDNELYIDTAVVGTMLF